MGIPNVLNTKELEEFALGLANDLGDVSRLLPRQGQIPVRPIR